MDKISKFIKKLSGQEQKRLKETIDLLLVDDTSNLDIKKLKGRNGNIFRVRAGSIRIIFKKEKKIISIFLIERRSSRHL